jgi:hypothetical protein
MEYTKPEVVLVGSAVETIQSSLTKNVKSPDSIQGPLTAASAYQADE